MTWNWVVVGTTAALAADGSGLLPGGLLGGDSFFFVWCRHGQAHAEWRPAGFFIIRYDIFRTKAGVAMTTIACPLILYSIRASFVSLF